MKVSLYLIYHNCSYCALSPIFFNTFISTSYWNCGYCTFQPKKLRIHSIWKFPLIQFIQIAAIASCSGILLISYFDKVIWIATVAPFSPKHWDKNPIRMSAMVQLSELQLLHSSVFPSMKFNKAKVSEQHWKRTGLKVTIYIDKM